MPALAPQASSEELLVVLLLTLLLGPLALLTIRCSFEGNASQVERNAEKIGQADRSGKSGEDGAGKRVERKHRQQAQRHPSCLREEGDGELRR